MSVRNVLVALRAAWWLAIVGMVVGGGAAYYLTDIQTPTYASHVQMFVASSETSTAAAAIQGSQFSEQRLASYARLANSRALARRVVEDTGIDTPPGRLAGQISVVTVPDTVLLTVTVTASTPEEAQRIARSVASQFPPMVAELETTPGQAQPSPVRVTVVEEPELPGSPISPDPVRNVVVGVVLGALVGLALPVVRGLLDRSVRSPEDLAELGCPPPVASVARSPALAAGRPAGAARDRAVAESFRQLRNRLLHGDPEEQPGAVVVASAGRGEGRSTVAVNLALAVAEAGRRVVLVEADLRHPSLAQRLQVPGDVGLTQVLRGEADLADVLRPWGSGKVSVITAGRPPADPGELFSADDVAVLVDQLREKSDFVLVDTPALLEYADASGLASRVDGVLLTVRSGRTGRDPLVEATAALEGVGAHVLGVVLTGVPARSARRRERGRVARGRRRVTTAG
ncbi:polysaccharide biosynthesis tyrosine autokinase [Blastococcus sp. SYSU D00695]